MAIFIVIYSVAIDFEGRNFFMYVINCSEEGLVQICCMRVESDETLNNMHQSFFQASLGFSVLILPQSICNIPFINTH